MLFRGKRELKSVDRIKYILETGSHYHVKKRVSPVDNVALLVDGDAFPHGMDALTHDKGSFRNNGSYYGIFVDGNVKKVKAATPVSSI